MNSEALQRLQRKAWGATLYRSLLNFVFLISAFSAFPDKQPVVALAFLAFSQSIAAVGLGMQITATAQNYVDDQAERKTRHAILLARNSDYPDYEFWIEVDRRVREEIGRADASTSGWAKFRTFIWGFAALLLGDLTTVVAAGWFAS